MSPANLMLRLPSAAVLLIIANFASAYPYAVSLPTKTIEFRELNVQPWPLATAAPGSLDSLLNRRTSNTVCGYVGGDPDLPATCSAGSHCVVDSDQGVIGCCPDSGACTQGVYTACVDSNSGSQSEVDPYVYTCSGSNSCYKNSFEGGYSQFGCGSASNLATTVAASASGKSAIKLTTLSATKTGSETTKTTHKSTSSKSKSTKSKTTETESTSKTESATSNTSESSATASSTGTETGSASQTSTDSSSSSTAASAPSSDGDDNGSKNTGAIIGGTISGVAALVALVALGVFLWKRKKNGQGLNEKQPDDNSANIQPLLAPGMQEARGTTPPPPSMPMPMPVARSTINPVIERDDDVEPYSSRENPYAYGPDIGMAVGEPHHMDHDETPLTREAREREMDGFNQGYNDGGLERIDEESRSTAAAHGPYPGPRGGGGGPLWQQNRGPGWF